MTTNGTITSAGLIKCFSLSVTGGSTSTALTPSVAGVHANNYGDYAFIDLAGTSSSGGYFDFTISGTDMKGRMVCINSSNQFEWYSKFNFHYKKCH